MRQRGAALVRLGRLLTGDRQHGEDLAQEVLARAFVRWGRIAAGHNPDAYLRRALVNASISRWRRGSTHEVPVAEPSDARSPQDVGSMVADRDEVWRLISRLPARQRAAVVLRYYEDLDDATIADLLGVTRETVRSQVKRAMDTLRTRISPALNGDR
ncbi:MULTISPECIES: SigE family RNA polymerase sigma factor [Dactylosporangium]|uniref:SigE family RNA polymerase sigma factor n=1 Tax=Dactylosporangium TaxID=35753 RepID=UPI0028C4FC48|nr:SigE family RNA polymerase sigma factor [Dactylosporangium matsuzakiense]